MTSNGVELEDITRINLEDAVEGTRGRAEKKRKKRKEEGGPPPIRRKN